MFVKEYHLYPDYQLTEEERHSMKEPQIKEKQEKSRGFKDEPHEINIAYYPTNTDIRNHIDAAKAPIQISKFDQVNLKAMVDEWSEFKKAGRYFSVLS